MKILVLTQYFWPETFLINDIVRQLVSDGHEVVVATGKPNYPEGRVFSGYRAWGFQREIFDRSIDIIRVPIMPRGEGGGFRLMINYLSFALSGVLFFPWLLRGRKFDTVLVYAPSPVIQVIPAIFLKWIKRVPLTLWVQDLWPESLQATGYVKNSAVLRIVGSVVGCLYRCCDLLLIQSKAFEPSIKRYHPAARIVYYPNSISDSDTCASPSIPDELNQAFADGFSILFAGNLGTAQSMETLVEAAVQLRDTDVRLILVGSGSRSSWLSDQKRRLKLDNLYLPGRFPAEVMPTLFQKSDALLVSLTCAPIFEQTVPSKVQAYLAAGRPILGSINGEGANVIRESGSGLVSPAQDASKLVENILRLKALDSTERSEMGRLGRVYFETHFEMSNQVRLLVDLLKVSMKSKDR